MFFIARQQLLVSAYEEFNYYLASSELDQYDFIR